jgi:DNA ligase-1
MEYKALVEIYQELESTTKRLEKTKILADFLKNIKEKSLSSIILLLQGRIFPSWDETKIGVASRLVIKAIAKATGFTTIKIEQEWKKTGDLGITAQNIVKKKTQSTLFTSSLTVDKVFSNIQKLSKLEGTGSIERKIELIAELLTSSKPEEARYIIRTLLEDLRVGIGEGTLRDAIIWAFFEEKVKIQLNEKDNKLEIGDREKYNEYSDAVQQAYDITNDFAVVAEIAKSFVIS